MQLHATSRLNARIPAHKSFRLLLVPIHQIPRFLRDLQVLLLSHKSSERRWSSFYGTNKSPILFRKTQGILLGDQDLKLHKQQIKRLCFVLRFWFMGYKNCQDCQVWCRRCHGLVVRRFWHDGKRTIENSNKWNRHQQTTFLQILTG